VKKLIRVNIHAIPALRGPRSMSFDRLIPILLLLGSNVFMTFAWYGHLKYKSAPLALAIFASWGSPCSSIR
jgi:hypothetical protein